MTPLRDWTKAGALLLAGAALLLATGQQARAEEQLKYPLGIRGRFTPQGMLIQTVAPGSECARAGLRRGDLITKVDSEEITSQETLVKVINSSGGSVILTVRRASTGTLERVDLDLRGGARRGGAKAPYLLGVAGDYTRQGMLVKLVAPGTPAAQAGIREGDLIQRINNQVITGQRELFAVLRNSGGVAVVDLRRGPRGLPVRLTADLRVYELGALGEFSPRGLLVRTVSPGTAAERVGLKPGDLIVAIDRQPVRSQAEFQSVLKQSGGKVALAVRKQRGGLVRLNANLVNNPLGAWCEPTRDGMRITTVPRGTPADRGGLERGDVIVKVDRDRVRSNEELTEALQESGGIATLLVRKGRTERLERVEVLLAR